jgi:hypothetical protein
LMRLIVVIAGVLLMETFNPTNRFRFNAFASFTMNATQTRHDG